MHHDLRIFSVLCTAVGQRVDDRKCGANATTQRGGLLLHRPTDDMGRFQTFVQPLFQSNTPPPAPHITDEAWKQQLIELHGKSSPKAAVRGRNARGGSLKRKRVEENMVWGLESITQRETQEKRKDAGRQLPYASASEDGACALQYLHRFGANIDAAELSVLVNFSSGRGRLLLKT